MLFGFVSCLYVLLQFGIVIRLVLLKYVAAVRTLFAVSYVSVLAEIVTYVTWGWTMAIGGHLIKFVRTFGKVFYLRVEWTPPCW